MSSSKLISSKVFHAQSDKVKSNRIVKAHAQGRKIADAVDAGSSPQERAATGWTVRAYCGQKLPAMVAGMCADHTAAQARKVLQDWAFHMAKVVRDNQADSKQASRDTYSVLRACNTHAESKGWAYKLKNAPGKELTMPSWEKLVSEEVHAGTTDTVLDAETANIEKAERKVQGRINKEVDKVRKVERAAVEPIVAERVATIADQLEAERVAHALTAADCARVYVTMVTLAKAAGIDTKEMVKASRIADKRAASTAKAIGTVYTGDTLASIAKVAKDKAAKAKAAKAKRAAK